MMNETVIKDFWNTHPCGDQQVGGLKDDYEDFFNKYDAFRYKTESHILRCLDEVDFKDKRVLEIGLGEGADSEQIIRRGGRWSGLDLTPESISRLQTRMDIRNLDYDELKCGSILDAPYEDNSFDIVFSHGVLHHVPNIHQAQKEIARVLKPDGKLVIMMYAKVSLNYLLSICVLRRLGLMFLYATGVSLGKIYDEHYELAKEVGLLEYLKMDNFIHRNTDGPLNPYSKVYTAKEIEADFPLFQMERVHKEHMHAPPLSVNALPGAGLMGWHLWAHMTPRK